MGDMDSFKLYAGLACKLESEGHKVRAPADYTCHNRSSRQGKIMMRWCELACWILALTAWTAHTMHSFADKIVELRHVVSAKLEPCVLTSR